MILNVVARTKALIAEGKTRDDVLSARLTASYDAKVPGGLDKLPGSSMATNA